MCRDSSFPFIMGAVVDGKSIMLNFYSFSGDPLFRAHQVREGLTYRFETENTGAGSQGLGIGFLRILREIGSEFSVKGLICGKLPFKEREGDLYQTSDGFLYEGDDFRVITDRNMRVLKADYESNDLSLKVSYSYNGEKREIPSALKVYSSRCYFTLDVEQISRGVGGDG